MEPNEEAHCPVGPNGLDSLAGVSFIDPAVQVKPYPYYRALRDGDRFTSKRVWACIWCRGTKIS